MPIFILSVLSFFPGQCNSNPEERLKAEWIKGMLLYAVVTPLRKAASYEPRIAILGIWGDTLLTRGKYGIYVAVRGSYEALTGSTWSLLESGEKFQNVQNCAT